jgi:hypothetical protein
MMAEDNRERRSLYSGPHESCGDHEFIRSTKIIEIGDPTLRINNDV